MTTGIVERLEEGKLSIAFRDEKEASAAIDSIKARLERAKAAVGKAREARDYLPRRAASDPTVTGADVRKADEAIAQAEAEVELLTLALPHAVGNARRSVQAAHAAAREAVERRPTTTASEIDAYLERLGRDRRAAAAVGLHDLAPMRVLGTSDVATGAIR